MDDELQITQGFCERIALNGSELRPQAFLVSVFRDGPTSIADRPQER